MAPFLEEPSAGVSFTSKQIFKGGILDLPNRKKPNIQYEPGRTIVEGHDKYEYDDLRPAFPDVHWDPLTEVPYHDRGIKGDAQFGNLLSDAIDIFDYNPKIGTEINGVNLAKLTDAQKDDLARLVSIRGVVFFRNQTDLDIDAQRELGQYFGQLHKHATTSVPRRGDLDDVHVVSTIFGATFPKPTLRLSRETCFGSKRRMLLIMSALRIELYPQRNMLTSKCAGIYG